MQNQLFFNSNENWIVISNQQKHLWINKSNCFHEQTGNKHLDFSGEVDSTELASAEGFSDFEIFQGPFSLGISRLSIHYRTSVFIPNLIGGTRNQLLVKSFVRFGRTSERIWILKSLDWAGCGQVPALFVIFLLVFHIKKPMAHEKK